MTPRGIRFNNPSNIDFNPRNAWAGQLGLEEGVAKPRFVRFDSPENGICALGKLLINYRGKDGLAGIGGKGIDTVLETINRWAASTENDTQAYARAVATRIGVHSTALIDIKNPATLRGMVVGIIVHENGSNPYAAAVIGEACGGRWHELASAAMPAGSGACVVLGRLPARPVSGAQPGPGRIGAA